MTDAEKYVDNFIAKYRPTLAGDHTYRLDLLQAFLAGYCIGVEEGFLIGIGRQSEVSDAPAR
jgi:hypothetical protein